LIPENPVLQIWERKEETVPVRVVCRVSRRVGERSCAFAVGFRLGIKTSSGGKQESMGRFKGDGRPKKPGLIPW
jgi:hypothetical protein